MSEQKQGRSKIRIHNTSYSSCSIWTAPERLCSEPWACWPSMESEPTKFVQSVVKRVKEEHQIKKKKKKKVFSIYILFQYENAPTSSPFSNTYSVWFSRLKKLWGADQVGGGSMITSSFWSNFWHLRIWGLSGWTVEENQTNFWTLANSFGALAFLFYLFFFSLFPNVAKTQVMNWRLYAFFFFFKKKGETT